MKTLKEILDEFDMLARTAVRSARMASYEFARERRDRAIARQADHWLRVEEDEGQLSVTPAIPPLDVWVANEYPAVWGEYLGPDPYLTPTAKRTPLAHWLFENHKEVMDEYDQIDERLRGALHPVSTPPPLSVWLGLEHFGMLEEWRDWVANNYDDLPADRAESELQYWLNHRYPGVTEKYSRLLPTHQIEAPQNPQQREVGIFSSSLTDDIALIGRYVWPRAENIEAEPEFKGLDEPVRTGNIDTIDYPSSRRYVPDPRFIHPYPDVDEQVPIVQSIILVEWLREKYPYTHEAFMATYFGSGIVNTDDACERFLAEHHPGILAEARSDGAIGG